MLILQVQATKTKSTIDFKPTQQNPLPLCPCEFLVHGFICYNHFSEHSKQIFAIQYKSLFAARIGDTFFSNRVQN